MSGKCYLVATPIGNLKDITLRAIETLKEVDIIACEDTRHTLVLLKHYQITKPLISYYQHKEKQGTEQIINLLKEGKNIALVSDAGMPCISDPGAVLVKALREENIDITVIPGASALTSAVALSGIEGNFTFIGFLSEKRKERLRVLEVFKDIPTALIIYSSPHDLIKNLDFLYEVLGARKIHVIKEITKIYENVFSGNLGEIQIENTKGEFVLVIEANDKNDIEVDNQTIKKALTNYLNNGLSKKDATNRVCQDFGLNKNRVYPLSLDI